MFGSLAKVASGAVSLLLLAATASVSAVKKDSIDTDVTQLRAFTLEMPYIDEGFHMRNYDFGGDAIVNTMERIRLTPDLPSRMGSLWSTSTLPTDYWKVDFEFRIGGKGGYLYGDGMGFFVTQGRAQPGPVFGNQDYINGLGVFFDTYPNGKHDFAVPFVMGMVGDGKTPYDGAHDGDANRLGMCEAYFRNLKQNSKASITYLKGQFINVQLKLQPKEKWINCFTITNVTLPENSYLGFTALTGDISDNHDIVSVRVETMRPEALKNFNALPNIPLPALKQAVAESSYFGVVFKLILAAGACGGLFVAYKKFTANNARRF
ncbi:hypothetical protein LPJ66_004961 [Kickxella alabastrina]|uniref:Uncharacterized protein n=1 Tax=Kickxella alabastrina TaxID=61397 RepID=A0ACC1IFK6_9FUNG|nr:hypothetical protein LPJ66_004961 [Kickxella alabastrina]